MPELPEVEVVARALRPELCGETIQRVEVRWARSIAHPSPDTFVEALQGLAIRDVSRRAKFLVISAPPQTLLVHLCMTGRLLLCERQAQDALIDRHVHVVFYLSSDRWLLYHDPRKFGRLYLYRDPEAVLGALGPEPLSDELTLPVFQKLLQRRRQIKPLLLDQHVLAGLGNIYADESLWRAQIHPCRRASDLNVTEVTRLRDAIRMVLRQAIAHNGTTFRDFRRPRNEAGEHQLVLAVYGRAGRPCRRCGALIERTVVGGRGTHYCPICQSKDDTLSREKGITQ